MRRRTKMKRNAKHCNSIVAKVQFMHIRRTKSKSIFAWSAKGVNNVGGWEWPLNSIVYCNRIKYPIDFDSNLLIRNSLDLLNFNECKATNANWLKSSVLEETEKCVLAALIDLFLIEFERKNKGQLMTPNGSVRVN